jgi:glycosyltransferase involved in cell wall biosynthesis
MRLVYLYTNHGAASPGQPVPHNPDGPTENAYALNFKSEGFFCLFEWLLQLKIVDEILIIVESARSPGSLQLIPRMVCRVIPHIDDLWRYLRDDDVIYCRGGFKFWFETLTKLSERKHWFIFYQAATQRGRWLFWDLVLNDLIEKTYRDAHGRIQYKFHKPTNPQLFDANFSFPRDFDICIGASHIHDKKAQWRGVDMMLEYRRQFGRDLRAILPGRSMNGEKTSQMFSKIRNHSLPVDLPGMLPREFLGSIYNRSKLYLHYGAAGQNDRGVLEAMACGCPVVIADGREQYHPPEINEFVYHVPDNPEIAARMIDLYLNANNGDRREKVKDFHDATHSIKNVIIPEFKHFLDFFRDHKKADRDLLWNYLNSSGS